MGFLYASQASEYAQTVLALKKTALIWRFLFIQTEADKQKPA